MAQEKYLTTIADYYKETNIITFIISSYWQNDKSEGQEIQKITIT